MGEYNTETSLDLILQLIQSTPSRRDLDRRLGLEAWVSGGEAHSQLHTLEGLHLPIVDWVPTRLLEGY